MYFDPLYFIFALPALILGLYAQFKVKSAFSKYSRVRNTTGITGAQAARRILDSNGLTHVDVERTQGIVRENLATANAWFEYVQSTQNTGDGIAIEGNFTGAVEIGGERIVSANNTENGIRLALSGLGGMPVVDFGGGLLGSTGQNSIYGNSVDMHYNDVGGATVMAQHNWWGPGGGTFAGSIDHSNPLAADPNIP